MGPVVVFNQTQCTENCHLVSRALVLSALGMMGITLFIMKSAGHESLGALTREFLSGSVSPW